MAKKSKYHAEPKTYGKRYNWNSAGSLKQNWKYSTYSGKYIKLKYSEERSYSKLELLNVLNALFENIINCVCQILKISMLKRTLCFLHSQLLLPKEFMHSYIDI